jgi:hypothetical protein
MSEHEYAETYGHAELCGERFNKLRGLIEQCFTIHFSTAHERFEKWVGLDRSLKALKKREKDDKENNRRRGDNRKLDETQRGLDYIDDITIPLGYFVLDTLEANMHDIFFNRDEIWQYGAVNPEEMPLVEKMGAKRRAADILFNTETELKNTIHCALKYNEGWTVPQWQEHYQTQYGRNDEGKKTEARVLKMEGVAFKNVSPYRIIRDPMVAPDDVKSMRFIGSWAPISRLDLSRVSGIEADKLNDARWMWPTEVDYSRTYHHLFATAMMDNFMTIKADLYIDLIPKDYNLSPSCDPEVWHFSLAGYDKIFRARKAKQPVDKYPYYSLVPSGDGADANPVGVMELIKDMIAMYNWLHSVRMAAVRQDLSGDYLVNEKLIRIEDLQQRDPYRGGNVIRLARQAWQNPNAMSNAIQRLQFSHDTKNYSADAQALFENIKIISSIVDPVSGIGDNPSSRRTAEEINRVVANASKRIKKLAGRLHATWLKPLGIAALLLTQANSKAKVTVRNAKGDWVEVEWYDILVPVETTVGDGYIMQDPAQLAQSWQTLLGYIHQSPQMLGMFKMTKMLEELGRAIGIPNMANFISPAGVAAAQAAAELAQSGGGGAPTALPTPPA